MLHTHPRRPEDSTGWTCDRVLAAVVGHDIWQCFAGIVAEAVGAVLVESGVGVAPEATCCAFPFRVAACCVVVDAVRTAFATSHAAAATPTNDVAAEGVVADRILAIVSCWNFASQRCPGDRSLLGSERRCR